ncbi:acylaminoacyl-peptidase [Idiomarina loihiensis]|uniref:alpha/beta hydrolase family protein n=1 Tax=Idiomarina TaxID=135575 RepID=UPI000D719848|nr:MULTISPECIES: S9 family peptidase [Idiomarina]PWW41741.1 acylaminoacyl-peptidase [Idiomarina loihiensis]TDP50799.1 acylaminoacyl-peptidase [Idiomarina loihiensis]TDS24923.1 acylaminoacyl-peptidase [Idiomarina sp. H2]
MRVLIKSMMCLLLLSIGSEMAYAKARQNVLEKYAEHAQFMDLKISPNGEYLAATSRDEAGDIQLTVLDVENYEIKSVTKANKGQSVNTFNWVSDDRLVMTLAREVGALDSPIPTGEILSMDVSGGSQTFLTGPRSEHLKRYTQIVDLLPNEPEQIMVLAINPRSKEPFIDLFRLKVDSGRSRPEGRIPLRWYSGTNVQVLLDDNGVSRLALGVDPEERNENVLMVRDGANEDWREVSRYNADGGSFDPVDITPNGNNVVGLSDTSTDTKALALMDLKTGNIKVLAEHPETDLMPIMSIKNGRSNELIGGAYEYDKIDVVLFDGVKDRPFQKIVQSLTQAFPNTQVAVNSATKDNSKMVLTVNSSNHPTEFYLFDSEKNALSLITKSRPWLDKKEIPVTEIMTYESRDGRIIKALLTLPKGVEAEDLPLILLPHGGPHGIRDSLTRLDTDAKVLAEHGYAVLQPNFRGSGGYGREFLKAGYRNWGTTMINDMTDGVMHLVDKGIADKSRMCVYGASYGGYAALMAVIREPDLYKCTVGFVGVYDLNLMFEQGDISEADAGQNYLSMVLPTDKEEREMQSPLHQLNKLKVPVFIIHGGKDVRVPIEHAHRLRKALDEKDHPYEWLVKEKEAHGFYKPENNIERWEKMLTFFNRHLH